MNPMITRKLILTANSRHPSADVMATKFETARVQYSITDPRSVAALLSNGVVESGLVPKREDGFYRTADRLQAVFPSFFDPKHGGRYNAANYLQNPEALFNLVYAGKRGNGDVASGDGFRFRGGGIIQTTFRNGYAQTGRLIGQDLERRPELIEEIGVSVQAACAYWVTLSSADACARRGDIAGTRRAVNGPAMLHLDDMLAMYRRLLPLLT